MTISGPTPDKPTYQSDFKESVELFEKSFQGMENSNLDVQKDKFKQVMKQSLETMQESANAMFNQKLADLKDHLNKDLNTYLESPTEENKERVQNDIQRIKSEEN
ncbi:MAG: hypothetical protein FJZ59_05105 [Chlamydiae bacterium]|nr:hypothetical protein [Chlamydiota bacterium]